MNESCQSRPSNAAFEAISSTLELAEQQVLEGIQHALSKDDPKPDAGACDCIFGTYTSYLELCEERRLTSRAAAFSRLVLIPAVLALEDGLGTQFHKGALFYDTGVAHFLSGNEDGYERFLAMADEEDVRKTAGTMKRGTANLRTSELAKQTIRKRMQFACDLLNGKIANYAADFSFLTGQPSITEPQFDGWRQKFDGLHEFELLRIIHDMEVCLGIDYPNYPAVADNPFVMLRLAKALSHLAQWVESCLTHWQGADGSGGALSGKLSNDTDFGSSLSTAAGSSSKFAGQCPKQDTEVDAELSELLADLTTAIEGPQRRWRLLRILYIVRNATAHTIEPKLAMYKQRAFLLNLLQAVFVSVFVICQLKGKPMH